MSSFCGAKAAHYFSKTYDGETFAIQFGILH